MSENVKKGENIVLAADNNIIIEQSTDFAKEKEQEQPVEEAKTEETPVSELITPDTVVSEIKVEEPSVGDVASVPEVPEIAVEAPKIDLDGLNLGDFNQSVAPEVSPSIDINPTADFGFGSVEPTQTPSYEAPTMDNNVGMFGGVETEQTNDFNAFNSTNSFENEKPSSYSSFDNLAQGITLEKVASTVVTKEDLNSLKAAAKEAQNSIVDEAFKPMEASVELNEKADKLLELVYNGEISGELYNRIRNWRNEYYGFKQVEDKNENKFSDDTDKVVPFTTQYNPREDQFGQFGGFGNDNSQDNTRGFAA